MNIPLTPIRFLERSVKVYGEKTGVICGEHRFTYKAFRERVNQLSNALLSIGVQIRRPYRLSGLQLPQAPGGLFRHPPDRSRSRAP